MLTGEAAYLGINALDFFKMTLGSTLILNPGSQYGKVITAEEAASLVDGSLWQPNERYVTKKPVEVMLGQPKNYPRELVDALTRLFKKDKRVKRAWLAHFFNPERDEKSHSLIAIEATEGFDAIAAEAGIVVRNVPIPDPPVAFMPITGNGGIQDYFLKDSKPFYERRFMGLF